MASAAIGKHVRRQAPGRRVRMLAVAAALVAGAVATADERAPEGSTFEVTRSVIASGGDRSTGGAFDVTGTIGQFDADPLHPATGGDFQLVGGFWSAQVDRADEIFRNGFETDAP